MAALIEVPGILLQEFLLGGGGGGGGGGAVSIQT